MNKLDGSDSTWRSFLAELEGAGATAALLPDEGDPRQRQANHRLLFQALAQGYFTAFEDPDFPDFQPISNNVFSVAMANPDFTYYQASIRGTRSYRLTGHRGGGLFVHVDMIAGGFGVMDEPGPSVGGFELDDLTLDGQGGFEVVLSEQRPAGYAGNWQYLPAPTRRLLVREAAYGVSSAAPVGLAIECLDGPVTRPALSADDIADRLQRLARQPLRYVSTWLRHLKRMHEDGLVNRLEVGDLAGKGNLPSQAYCQGLFDIPEGHALVLETVLPRECVYWNIQLSDPLWSAINWLDHQCSLNGGQAAIDADGMFRAVIALDDPGVPNWLDPAGNRQGAIMIRYMRASGCPMPTLKIVAVDSVRAHLPAATPMIDGAERRHILSLRRRQAQLRRRW